MSDERHTRVKPGAGTQARPRAERRSAPRESGSLVGEVLGGKYEVVGLVGTGGMGAVYRAVQRPLGREVAVKVIHGGQARPDRRRRFHREAEVIARLSHSSTVRLYDYFEDAEGSLFMVLELIAGRSLRHELEEVGRLGEERVARIGLQVLGALAEAHATGVVHRDLKPDNLMLVEERLVGERVKVLDFGIAHLVAQAEDERGTAAPRGTRFTWDGYVVGSPHYMAPEQASGARVGPRADLYALGTVMFELLTGRPPYDGSALELLAAHETAPVPDIPGTLASPGLRAVVRRAMAKAPLARFSDAEEMARAIYAAVPKVLIASGSADARGGDDEEAERTVVDVSPLSERGAPHPPEREATRVLSIDDLDDPPPPLPRRAWHPPPSVVAPPPVTGEHRQRRWPLRLGVGAALALVLMAVLLQPRKREPPAPAPRPEPARAAATSDPDAMVAAPADAAVVARDPDAAVVARDPGVAPPPDARVRDAAAVDAFEPPARARKPRRKRRPPPRPDPGPGRLRVRKL